MPRQRTGSVNWNKARKYWEARLDWVDELTGKSKCRKQKVVNKTEGRLVVKKWIAEMHDHGEEIIDGDRLTFTKLAEIYRTKKLIEPVYQGETLVAGLRSWKSQQRRLRTLDAHFGGRRIRAITHSDIEQFKLSRLAKKTEQHGTDRKAADVNRDLQLLRAVLNFARRQGWITRNPFSQGEPLIEISREEKRDRVLSREEEASLLAACEGPRAHLRPILIAALDTAMRRGELIRLQWGDIDFIAGQINVRATTTKTKKPRAVPITKRLRDELQRLKEAAPADSKGLVFGINDSFKKSFASACRIAEIKNFRFHDTRHTAITRWIQQGMPPMQVMAISGHTQMTTFARYVNADNHALRRAAELMDSFHAVEIQVENSTYVN